MKKIKIVNFIESLKSSDREEMEMNVTGRMKKCISIIICIAILIFSTTPANAESKTIRERKLFYGLNDQRGASTWGVDFEISVNYDNSSSVRYTAESVCTSATMRPKHLYGVGDVIIAGLNEQVDYGTVVDRSIRPTTSSSWQFQPLIVATGTHVYYSYKATLNQDFRYVLEERGVFTFAVPGVIFFNPNCTLNLSVMGPR